MLSNEMVKEINEQINKEFYSAYLYQEFANYYGEVGLDGFRNWYQIQAKEELAHGMLFVDYLIDNDRKVVFEAIDDPSCEFNSFKEPLVQALKHEQYITKSINDLYDRACAEKDYRTQQILNWFIKEQYEEEINAQDMITRYELFGADKRSLWEIDNELKARTFTAPEFEV